MILSASADLFYSAVTFGDVAEATDAALQTPEPELRPFGEGLAIVDLGASSAFLSAHAPHDRATIISQRKPDDLRSVAHLIATSHRGTAHFFKTPAEILDEVRRVVRTASQKSGGSKPLSEEVVYALMCKYVSELVGRLSLEEAISQIVERLTSLWQSQKEATTSSGAKHLAIQRLSLLRATIYLLQERLTEMYEALTLFLKQYPPQDPREHVVIDLLGAIGPAGLENWERIFTAIEQKSEADCLLWVRLLYVLRAIGLPALTLLEKMKNESLIVGDQRIIQDIIDRIRS